jgi:four helix bundle protein
MELVKSVYGVTDSFPQNEMYGLMSQLRRAAVSIPSNIAEGQAHYTNREFVRFLRLARGSLAEIETQLLIAQDRKYVSKARVDELLKQTDELGRVLSGLIKSMKESLGDDRQTPFRPHNLNSGLATQDSQLR